MSSLGLVKTQIAGPTLSLRDPKSGVGLENCILNLGQVFKKHAVLVIREHKEGVEWVGRETLQMTLCKLITTVGKTTQNHNQVSNIIFGL